MNKVKQSEKLLAEVSRGHQGELPTSPRTFRSTLTHRFPPSLASTSISKTSFRSPRETSHQKSLSTASSTKFIFPKIDDKTAAAQPSSTHKRQQSTITITSSDHEPSLKSHPSSSQKVMPLNIVSGLSQPSLFLAKSQQFFRKVSMPSPSPTQETKHARNHSDALSSILHAYETKLKQPPQVVKTEPEVFLKKAIRNSPELAHLPTGRRVKLHLFKEIMHQIILDLEAEKSIYENKSIIRRFELGDASKIDYALDYFEKKKQLMVRPLEACEKIMTVLQSLILTFFKTKSKRTLDEGMGKLVTLGRESQNAEIHLHCLKIWGKMCRERRDIQKAEHVFKQHKHFCNIHRSFENKVLSYKNLGCCAQEKLKHTLALSYFIKMLQMSWFVGNTDLELKAYDLIGLQYFYMNKLDKAMYYHLRAMTGMEEIEGSELKKLGVDRALRKLPKDAMDIKKGKKKTDHTEIMSLAAENAYASSDEEVDLPLPKEYDEMMQRIEKNRNIAEAEMNLAQAKTGKVLTAKKKEVNIREIFKDARRKEPHGGTESSEGKALEKLKKKIIVKPAIGPAYTHVSDKLLISHLSPNRGLENFSNINLYTASLEKDIIEDHVDSKSAHQALKKLEKLHKNIETVRDVLSRMEWNDETRTFSFNSGNTEKPSSKYTKLRITSPNFKL